MTDTSKLQKLHTFEFSHPDFPDDELVVEVFGSRAHTDESVSSVLAVISEKLSGDLIFSDGVLSMVLSRD